MIPEVVARGTMVSVLVVFAGWRSPITLIDIQDYLKWCWLIGVTFDADDDGDDKENSFIKAPWDDIYIYYTSTYHADKSHAFQSKGNFHLKQTY